MLDDFLIFMESKGCAPSDVSEIIADDVRRYYSIAGDRPTVKKGCYQLATDDEFMYGWFINFREGETHSYYSKPTRKFTDEERREWARRTKEAKERRRLEQGKSHAAAAKKAREIWNSSAEAGVHAYLEKKGIVPVGCKENAGSLVIPAYKNGKMVSLQFIDVDGDKKFLPEGEISGAYSAVVNGKDFSKLLICEGWATGVSLHMATNLPVVVAFNAGNLMPVSKAMKEKYPESEIFICGDNDAFTQNQKGELWNVGKEKAEAAAAEIKSLAILPEIIDTKNTDWNDFHKSLGIEALSRYLGVQLAPLPAPNPEPVPVMSEVTTHTSQDSTPSSDWREKLVCQADGKLAKNSLTNVILMLTHHHHYEGMLRYDEFSNKIMVLKPIVPDPKFRVHVLNDRDITALTASLEHLHLNGDVMKTHRAIETVAHDKKFNPAREYFDTLQWDGVERLKNWLAYYLGAEGDDPEYLAFIGTKWLAAAVKRVYSPGCKFDHVLVIEGDQGKGKSTALRVLATFGDDEETYFTDGINIADLGNKDTIQKLQGAIIVEMAELSGFNKKEDEEIKRWITLQWDDTRLPFARTNTRFPRQFVLSATTNNHDYLKDPSGNRRYWPFRSSTIDLEALMRDKVQLWAEAVHLFKSGMYIGPTPEEMKLAVIAQDKRKSRDVWEPIILEKAEQMCVFRLDDLLKDIGIQVREMDARMQRRVTNILRQAGYDSYVSKDLTGKSMRRWEKVEKEEVIDF